MWVDCFVKGRQMQPGGGKIVFPMGKWSVEPWQGGREGRPGQRAMGSRPLGAPSSRPVLPAVVGNTKRKRVGWEALAPLSAEIGPLTSNDYCV